MSVVSSSPTSGDIRLSAILNMFENFDAIRKTVRHLCAQTVRNQLELIIVTLKPELVDTSWFAPLGGWQVVCPPEVPTAAAGWAAGSRYARAVAVVLCEDHSFPEPGWAEAIMESHNADVDAVAPAIQNGNPGSIISWANFQLTYLEWSSPDCPHVVSSGPGHNTSYKVALLREYDADLESWFNPERVMHLDMEAKGRRIRFDPRARTHHVNISRGRSYLVHSFLGGRIFGGSRAAGWSKARALAQAIAFPIVPLIRLRRILGILNSPAKRRESRFWAALPWTLLGLSMHAAGEAVGYLAGAGNSMGTYMDFETRRIAHVMPSERALLLLDEAADREQVQCAG